MKRTRYAILFLMVAILCSSLGCKKEEEATKPNLIGTIQTNMPLYIQIGDTITVNAWGITWPEEVTWKWYASSMTTDTLVCNPVTLAVPDSIGEFGLMVGAYKLDYYATTTTLLFQTIDTASVETFYGPVPSSRTFTDLRDGFTYDVIRVGKLDWFAQNLAWDGAGYPYQNSRILDIYFGRYYTWKEATTACPEGWRLPNNNDWCDLASTVSGKSLTFFDDDNWKGVGEKLTCQAWFLGTQLWEFWPRNQHTNTVGWNGLPMGFAFPKEDVFDNYCTYAFFWSADEASAEQAYYRYVYQVEGEMPAATGLKDDIAMSVRCVRDAIE